MTFEKDAIYVTDKAYVDLEALTQMALADQVIILKGAKSLTLYPKPLRMVTYWDAEKAITSVLSFQFMRLFRY